MPMSELQSALGVYVHWPFCASKCPYCDFNSHVRQGGVDETRFLAALGRELAHMASLAGGRSVGSVFFGGGTPSLMSPQTVGAVLDAIARHWRMESNAEVTLEANPSSVEADRFRGYRAAGINRASLGVQSLRDADLRALGRLHSVAEAKQAVAIAGSTFERFSFDLIYARPGQTRQSWRQELEEALAMVGQHLSLYQLTIEQGTPFAALHAAGKLAVPEAELADELYDLTQDMTQAAGLPAYEISNHARPGEESRHNLVYWRYGEYVGVGAGAHSRVVAEGKRRALVSERHPERWLAAVEQDGHAIVEDVVLTPAEQADEALLMGLRLAEGVDLARLAEVGGVQPAPRVVSELVELGLLEARDENRLRATPRGRFVLNEVVRKLSMSFVAAS
jgi:oxygen-independent coproporphyrinogen-3 oxidase